MLIVSHFEALEKCRAGFANAQKYVGLVVKQEGFASVYLQQPDNTLIDKCKAQQSQRKLDNACYSVATRRFLNCCCNNSYKHQQKGLHKPLPRLQGKKLLTATVKQSGTHSVVCRVCMLSACH